MFFLKQTAKSYACMDVGMDRHRAQTSASKLSVCCKLFLVGFTKSPKMMAKMFLMLALLAHGAAAIRSGTGAWLSEGQLEQVDETLVDEEKVEKKPQFVEKIFKKARNLKGWFSRKLGKKKIDQVPDKVDENPVDEKLGKIDEKLMVYLQQRVQEELGIPASRHQVEEFLRTVWAYVPRMEQWGVKEWSEKLPSDAFRFLAKFRLPLDVSASAVAFCSELAKAMGFCNGSRKIFVDRIKKELRGIERELRGAEELCSQVLTGNLSKMSNAPEWAKDAAEVAEMDKQQHPYGRLDGVAWKHSLKRVCHDECEELVEGIRKKARELADSANHGKGTLEDACAAHVVRHVEAEILGCCSKSCGWNGQFCSFFPFLSSKEQVDWQAECCSERNILKGSSRQRLCDSTLSQPDKIKSQNLTDQRPNKAKDRDILGQDESPASDSWSLMERSGGSVDQNTCPPPIDLDKVHKELREKEWKRMPFDLVEMGRRMWPKCGKQQPSRGACKAFLLKETTDNENKKRWEYICCDTCGLKPPADSNPELKDLTDPAPKADGFLYVHKDIYSTEWNIVPKLTSP